MLIFNHVEFDFPNQPVFSDLNLQVDQGDFIFPIPGSTKISHIEENIEATSIRLTREELNQIDELIPKGAASGTRYPEAMMKSVNR